MKKIFGVLLAGFIMFGAMTLLQSASLFAQSSDSGASTTTGASPEVKDKVCEKLKELDSTSCAADSDSAGILNGVIQPILQTLILVIGAVSVVVIVIGGLMYVLSAGDANNVKRAKDTIMYAAIGLIVALIAQTIVSFVIGAL